MVFTTRLFAASLLLSAATLAQSYHLREKSREGGFVFRATRHDGFAPTRNHSFHKRANMNAQRCPSRSPSSSTAPLGGVGAAPTTTTTTTTTATTSVNTGSGGDGGGGGDDHHYTGPPPNWPTTTQAGPTYTATSTSPEDPNLTSISEALNFDSVPNYNGEHLGEMTYYETGQVACGDYYTENTFTAAVSKILFESWPQSDQATDRAAICGPYTPGRQIIGSDGLDITVIPSTIGTVLIGGDGLPNCLATEQNPIQCHIPLSITITNPKNGKWAVVSLVDQCEACAEHDIDVTLPVFKSLSDPNLGRVNVTWHFNHF